MLGQHANFEAEQERLRLLFRQSRSTSIVAAMAATATAALIHWHAPQAGVWVWLACIWALTAARQLLYRNFFHTEPGSVPVRRWLSLHGVAAVPVGVAAGALPLLDFTGAPGYVRELQTLVPALVVMAAVSSFGVYFYQYLVLLVATVVTVVITRLVSDGSGAIPMVVMFAMFAPILALTARRYASSIAGSLYARHRSEELVRELTTTNGELENQNLKLARQREVIHQEEELAKHVFHQLTLGGKTELPGVHTWNQPMGSLSGDLIQTARGPDGQDYVLLADFTGHGLPAALGALPASSVFLAMAAKGLPVETIAIELNRKLHELLPVGYFCCAVMFEVAPDRRSLHVWNGGLPPVLIRRAGTADHDQVESHSVPLGVLASDQFDTAAQCVSLRHGDLVYAHSDGLTEAENLDGEIWGAARLHAFLGRDDLTAPKLPALIETVLEHVNLAPPSDDISVVELVVDEAVEREADAA